MSTDNHEPTDQTATTSLSPIADYNTLELTAARDILPLKEAVYDVATSGGMATAKADLKLVTSFLTSLEAIRKKIKAPAWERCQQIDSEAKRIAQPVERDIKAPLKALIDAEEGRLAEIERKRVAAIRAKIDALRARPAWGATLDEVQRMLQAAEAVTVDDSFAELQDEAAVAQAEALRDLREIHRIASQNLVNMASAAAIAGDAGTTPPPPTDEFMGLMATMTTDQPAGHARLADPQPVPGGTSVIHDSAMALREAVRLMDSIAFGLSGPDADSLKRARFLVLKVIGLLT